MILSLACLCQVVVTVSLKAVFDLDLVVKRHSKTATHVAFGRILLVEFFAQLVLGVISRQLGTGVDHLNAWQQFD